MRYRNHEMDNCPKCNLTKLKTSKLCTWCKRGYSRPAAMHRQVSGNDFKNLDKFVSKIESRGGWCNIQELLVELITLNQVFGDIYGFNHLQPHKQLMKMYDVLKTINFKNKQNNEKNDFNDDTTCVNDCSKLQ
jgi:hypothetical protein